LGFSNTPLGLIPHLSEGLRHNIIKLLKKGFIFIRIQTIWERWSDIVNIKNY